MALTRRSFVTAGVGTLFAAAGGLRAHGQGLGQFSAAGPACADAGQTTPAVPRDATFRPGSPARTAFVEAAAVALTLTGTVSGVTCGRIKGARVDFWHADAAGVYDMRGNRFRGHQFTDAAGGYRLTTIMPGSSGGRAPHIGVNVNVPGKVDFWTEVFLPGDSAQAKDPRFNKALVIRMLAADGAGSKAGVFDFVLNL